MKSMTILIVEDEDILSKVLRDKFEEANFKVVIAEDGAVVLDMARKIKPDAILLDILLPKIDGLEVLSRLKSDDELKTIPVMVMTNLNDDDKLKKALGLGAVDYMIKTQHPVNEIVERIKEYVLKAK